MWQGICSPCPQGIQTMTPFLGAEVGIKVKNKKIKFYFYSKSPLLDVRGFANQGIKKYLPYCHSFDGSILIRNVCMVIIMCVEVNVAHCQHARQYCKHVLLFLRMRRTHQYY
jgi:hypothetical protein